MNMTLEHPTSSILEPLTAATTKLFQKPNLFPNDYLEVDVDDKGKHFIVKAVAYKTYTGVIPHGQSDRDLCKHMGSMLIRDTHGPSGAASSHWVNIVPERKDAGFGMWNLAATDFTALVIQHCWPFERLIFKQDLAKTIYISLLVRYQSQNINAVRAAEYDLKGILPPLPEDFVNHPEWPLLKHQYVPLVNSLMQPAYALFMEQGTCKTSTCIYRICLESTRKRRNGVAGVKTIYRVLIVCPNAVRQNWANEFQKFATSPGKVTVIDGDYGQRMRRQVDGTTDDPTCDWTACVVGYDTVEPSLDHLMMSPWDLVICDESHWVKNHRTNRWACLKRLREGGRVRQWMALTGTPIANSIMDLWAQFELMGAGLSGFISYKHFTQFHGKYVHNMDNTGTAVEKLIGLKNIPLIQERMARLSYRITKKKAGLNLPDKVYDVIEIQMTDQQAGFYKKIERELAVEISQMLQDEDNGRKIRADHILTKLLRLAQITSGHYVLDEERDEETGNLRFAQESKDIPGGNPKIDCVLSNLLDPDKDPNSKTIIWACFRHDILTIKRRLDEAGIKSVVYFGDTSTKARDQAVTDFNTDPTVKVFIANAQTAGAGLNLLGYDPLDPDRLTTYCDWEVFFSQGWSSVLRSQAEDRAHRKGTRTNVRITDMMVLGTVDEEIRKAVTKKRADAEAVQDIDSILRNVLGMSLTDLREFR